MRKILIIAIGVGMALAFATLFVSRDNLPVALVRAGEETFRVEIAATDAARRTGLSGRPGLSPRAGMLFLYPDAGRHGFWMKDMQFPIDIIWLRLTDPARDAYVIIDIAPDVPPPSASQLPTSNFQLPIYYPRAPADAVLELSAGTAERLNLKIGDPVVRR